MDTKEIRMSRGCFPVGGVLGTLAVAMLTCIATADVQFVRSIGGLSYPNGIAKDAAGNIWVADTGHSQVKQFSPSGSLIRTIGGEGGGDGQFYYPNDVAVDPSGNIWVADSSNHRIQKFSSTGTFLQMVNRYDIGYPVGLIVAITADSMGNIWVADETHHTIFKLNPSGVLLDGVYGDYQVNYGMTAAGTNVWVCGRIGVYEYDANLNVTGSLNDFLPENCLPRKLAIDRNGNFWMTSSQGAPVVELSGSGQFIQSFGSLGAANGQFRNAWGIAIDDSGNLWIVDSGNGRIEVFKVPEPATLSLLALANIALLRPRKRTFSA